MMQLNVVEVASASLPLYLYEGATYSARQGWAEAREQLRRVSEMTATTQPASSVENAAT